MGDTLIPNQPHQGKVDLAVSVTNFALNNITDLKPGQAAGELLGHSSIRMTQEMRSSEEKFTLGMYALQVFERASEATTKELLRGLLNTAGPEAAAQITESLAALGAEAQKFGLVVQRQYGDLAPFMDDIAKAWGASTPSQRKELVAAVEHARLDAPEGEQRVDRKDVREAFARLNAAVNDPAAPSEGGLAKVFELFCSEAFQGVHTETDPACSVAVASFLTNSLDTPQHRELSKSLAAYELALLQAKAIGAEALLAAMIRGLTGRAVKDGAASTTRVRPFGEGLGLESGTSPAVVIAAVEQIKSFEAQEPVVEVVSIRRKKRFGGDEDAGDDAEPNKASEKKSRGNGEELDREARVHAIHSAIERLKALNPELVRSMAGSALEQTSFLVEWLPSPAAIYEQMHPQAEQRARTLAA